MGNALLTIAPEAIAAGLAVTGFWVEHRHGILGLWEVKRDVEILMAPNTPVPDCRVIVGKRGRGITKANGTASRVPMRSGFRISVKDRLTNSWYLVSLSLTEKFEYSVVIDLDEYTEDEPIRIFVKALAA